ncbi:MAG TPA: cupin domain-containing protein [Pyrinomonadaceae bacterium]|jgi:hypothetical protein
MQGRVFDNLEQLLEPCLAGEFLASSWGKSYRHVRGWPGKFSQLLPWNHLNEILGQHRLDFPRLRLTQDGRSLPSSAYLRHTVAGRRKVSIPRILPAELTAQLRQGATLVLDAVDELHRPLTELAAGLERTFHVRAQINVYAGWRTSRGFDLHWDDHDVFILQVAGQKRWSLYGMTRPFPLTGEQAEKPSGAPLWEETLTDGDLLYIPRGWWHVALPLNEPTLHLTVGIHNPTGIELLRWLTERMRASETFRMDLPRFASARERAVHLQRMRAELLAEWGADLLERYQSATDAAAEARPQLSLPWSATPETLPPGQDVRLRLTAPRPLELNTKAQPDAEHPGRETRTVEFSCLGKRWRFAAAAIHLLRPLGDAAPHSVSELLEAASGKLDEQTVRAFLGELLAHGLLAVVRESQT